MAAVIAGLVPNGLFLMVVVAYAMGALRIVGYGALIQQANSVESLSNVNVLCMDKTGTLTANRIHFHDLLPLGMDRKDLERILGDFARSASGGNRTTEALHEAFEGQKRTVIEEIPFSSERKWSALVFDDESAHGVYVLGALEMLQPHLVPGFDVSRQTAEWTAAGLRVLLFAHQPHKSSLFDSDRQPDLPPDLSPLCVLSFRDELRPALKETLEGFTNAGIELKVISGDDPQTVRSLARQAGLPGDLETVVSGLDLDEMDTDALERAAGECSIFGRIRPSQKERLVEVLRKQGQYVAMIGDGVNDVLSLKKANLGIAMESGSAATRAVADMVLLNDSFSALPPAFLEGQRIVNGMKDILRLFLTRAIYFSLLIIAVAMIGIGFPYVPTHATLVMFLSVGIPTFALALWARPGGYPKRGLIGEVMHFVLPAAITTALFGLLIYTLMYNQAVPQGETGLFSLPPDELNRQRLEFEDTDVFLSPDEFDTEAATLAAQTSLTVFTSLSGLILLVFVEPPVQFFVGGDEFSGDRRPTALMIAMLLVFTGIMVVEPLRHFFGLLVLSRETYLMIFAAVAGWMFVVRAAWRSRWMERLLQLEPTE
jgi:cation-transporting ATPase E